MPRARRACRSVAGASRFWANSASFLDARARARAVMDFNLEGLRVFFPYPQIYPEQLAMMTEFKRSLDARGDAIGNSVLWMDVRASDEATTRHCSTLPPHVHAHVHVHVRCTSYNYNSSLSCMARLPGAHPAQAVVCGVWLVNRSGPDLCVFGFWILQPIGS